MRMLAENKLVGRTRAGRVVGLVGLAMVLVIGCTVPSENPDGSVPQTAPIGINGMAEEPGATGGTVWGADYFGHQLLRFDINTGAIAERYGSLCDTDDVVVAPDGSLLATCAGDGIVLRVHRDGTSDVLATVGKGVNPIALSPDETAVYVGFGNGDDDKVIRVPLDGGPTQVVASGLPILNGFGFGPDGLLYAPTGGVDALLGNTGGLMSIDVTTGETRQIPLNFIDDPAKTGLAFAVGVEVGADGTVYIAQGVNPEVWAVDPATGDARLVGRSPFDTADNLVILSDGRILLSPFLGNGVVVFTPDGSGGWVLSATNIGG